MSIFRSVLAQFAIDVDVKPLGLVDRKIEKLKANLFTVGKVAATGFTAAATAAWMLNDAASHAAETIAALKATIGDAATAGVEAWSEKWGEAIGRSQYDLQDSMLRFSAFLEPQFKGTNHDIVEMSKNLSLLAVDLAAFYDTADSEALMRLFSGMSGETEAVRRLGIDISDSSLDDFNKKQGDNRRLAALTLPEKTLLRFRKILTDTTAKQGHAAKEAEQWAGSLKRVEGRFKTMAVKWGRMLEKQALSMLRTFEKVLIVTEGLMDNLVNKTSVLQTLWIGVKTAMAAAAGYFTVMALATPGVVPQLAHMLGYLKPIALALGAFMIFEDVYTFLRGGESLLGRALTYVTGMKDPLSYVQEAWSEISVYAYNFVGYIVESVKWIGHLISSIWKIPELMIKAPSMKGDDLNKWIADYKKGFSFQPDVLDPEQVREQREQRREGSFTDTVAKGDLVGAVEHRRVGETKEEAYQRAKDERKRLVAKGEVAPTKADLDSGFFFTGGNIQSVPHMSAPQAIPMSSTHASNTTIYVTNANVTKDELEELIQKANAGMLESAAAPAGEEH